MRKVENTRNFNTPSIPSPLLNPVVTGFVAKYSPSCVIRQDELRAERVFLCLCTHEYNRYVVAKVRVMRAKAPRGLGPRRVELMRMKS